MSKLALLRTKRNRGIPATTHDLVMGIATTVGRIDEEAEQTRELLRQVSADVKKYAAAQKELADKFLEVFQKMLAVPDPTKPAKDSAAG